MWFNQSINLLERHQSYLGMSSCQRHWQHDIYWGFTAGRSNGVNAKIYTSKMSAQIQPNSSKLMRWHFIIHTANVNTWWRGCIFLIDWVPKQPKADSDCCEWQGELHRGRGKPSADVCGSKSKSIFHTILNIITCTDFVSNYFLISTLCTQSIYRKLLSKKSQSLAF